VVCTTMFNDGEMVSCQLAMLRILNT